MRRKARVTGALEKLSVGDSLRAVRACQVAALLVDATGPMDKQDFAIAAQVVEEGRALVIAANKWDLVEHKDVVIRQLRQQLDNALTQSPEGVTPIHIREALISMVKEADFPDRTQKRYLEFLQDTIHKAYLEILEREITKAFVYAYEEQAEALFQNYLDHAEAFVNKTSVKDRDTREELRRHFEIDREMIVIGVLDALRREGKIEASVVAQAIKDLGVNTEKLDPLEV